PNNGLLGTVGVGIAVTLPVSELEYNFSGTRNYTVTNIDANVPLDGETDYKSVTVTVEWDEPTEPTE
ncbi:unnamed protein product, partial [marine sediment metagenome]